MESAFSHLRNPCPFCSVEFKRLGNHLPFCSQRNGRDYTSYLSLKTTNKRANTKKQQCPNCGKCFKSLDTHMRVSATCRLVPSTAPTISEPTTSSSVVASNTESLEIQNFHTSTHQLETTTINSGGLSELSLPILAPFNCPKTAEDWVEVDQHLATVLAPAVLSAPSLEEKNLTLCSGIYNYFSSKYGTHTRGRRGKQKRPNNPQTDLNKLKEERNRTRCELRRAKKRGLDTESIRALASKFHQLLRQYRQITKVQNRRSASNVASRERKECAQDFSRFAKKVLDDENTCSTEPAFAANTAENYFRTVYHTDHKVFQQPHWLPDAPTPNHPFDESPFTLSELQGTIKKTRVKSAPSPLDQVTYLVFKRCPSLWPVLLDLFNMCWRLQTVPSLWKKGVIRLIPKAAASAEPHLPSNYRPIALTSCVGKLFTTMLKNRWLKFMVSNNYLDTSVQKAFLPDIPGCLEQYQKLQTIISDAHHKHRSLTVCWLDLANAYGSVHHQLITYCLQHYHAPQIFLDTITNLYTDLSAIITSRTWSTNLVPLRTGVYQGDPLSVIIFNTVMSTLADNLRASQHFGYTLSGTNTSTNVLLYADDTCLVADGPASCQYLLSQVERWLQWTGMTAKVPKCFTLSIQASTAKRFNPHLRLHNQTIPFIGDTSIKFLGGPISVPSNTQQHRQHLQLKMQTLLERADKTAVSRKQKLLLYKAGICPRLNWDLAIMDLPMSWISSSLEAMATRYLKRWSGLARSANTARLYLPKTEGGLALPSVSLLYQRLKVSQASLLLTSRDRVTQEVTRRVLYREENQTRVQFKPVTYSRDIMADDPGVRRQTLTKRVKSKITTEDAIERREQAEALPHQGQMLRDSNLTADLIWATAVSKLSSSAMKFALNSATDTLPHNSNLAKWYKGLHSGLCKLCGKQQTQIHVLNNCEVALKLRRYNPRHDKILAQITKLAQAHLPDTYQLTADLPENTYHFPSHITPTSLRPDLVLWSDAQRKLHIVELTICFESGFNEAAERKRKRYTDLAEETQQQGYHTQILPIQVGSRGVIEDSSLEKLRHYLKPISQKTWQEFLIEVVVTTIEESHRIWCDRNHIN